MTQLRKQCVMLAQQIEETKNDYLFMGGKAGSNNPTMIEEEERPSNGSDLQFRDS